MMARQCTSCGTEIGPGINFCPNCGTPAPAEAPPPEVQPQQPAPAPIPIEQTAPMQPSPAYYDPTAQGGGPVWTPPPGGTPMAAGGGGGMGTSGKIAAAVGALVLIGGLAAGAKVLTSKKEDRTTPVSTIGGPAPTVPAPAPTGSTAAPAPTSAPTSAPPPVEPTTEPEPAPESGSVAEVIPQEVGKWSAVDAQPAPDVAANWGANDAITVTYVKPNGASLGAIFAAYPSADDAYGTVDALAESLTGAGYQIVEAFDLTLDSGEVIGRVDVLEGPDTIVFWSNGPFLISAEGTSGDVQEFFQRSPI